MIDLFTSFQRVLLRIFGLGFNRKFFSYTFNDGKFIIENSSRNSYITLILNFIILLIVLKSFWLYFTNNKFYSTIDIVLIFIFIFLGVFALRKLLWAVNGREVLEINEQFFIVKKKGTFFTKKIYCNLSDIMEVKSKYDYYNYNKLIQNENLANNMLLIKESNKEKLKLTIGEIFVICKYKTIPIFNDLSNEEIKFVIDKIRERIDPAERSQKK